jgi:hypothetical protein
MRSRIYIVGEMSASREEKKRERRGERTDRL